MSDLFAIEGKHVLVTGASSGFGRHFALVLAGCGARVTVAARRAEAIDKSVQTASSRCHAKSASGRRHSDFQAAATTPRHVFIAGARSTRWSRPRKTWSRSSEASHPEHQKGIRHSIKVEYRSADDLDDIGGCGLLLQRFRKIVRLCLQLVGQTRVSRRASANSASRSAKAWAMRECRAIP
jgi:hypothetical protein